MSAPITATIIPAVPARSGRASPRASAEQGGRSAEEALVDLIVRRRFLGHAEFERTTHAIAHSLQPIARHSKAAEPDMVDYLFLTGDPPDPGAAFERVRWGGEIVYISRDRAALEAAAGSLAGWRTAPGERGAWVIEQRHGSEQRYLFNLRLLGWRTPVHYMVARKVMLVPPGISTDRFTYNVYLDRNRETSHYEVVKEVPTEERVLARLREKFPEADEDSLRRRAHKFTDKIFPVFLTRETAILRLLQRDLPKKFRNQVPRVLAADIDERGYTRALRLKWLRARRTPVGGRTGDHGRPLSQLEFARQAAELLTALHDSVGVIHLDLRLDNFVITDHGVGFVDFGSAVRVGEDFPESSLLSNLFDEMMRTSQIQRMLGRMTESGLVTSEEIRNCYQRIDKAVDFFFLAVQVNAPLANPEFRGLVDYDPQSPEAVELAKLTDQILRPADTRHSRFTSASEILRGIEEIERRLGRR